MLHVNLTMFASHVFHFMRSTVQVVNLHVTRELWCDLDPLTKTHQSSALDPKTPWKNEGVFRPQKYMGRVTTLQTWRQGNVGLHVTWRYSPCSFFDGSPKFFEKINSARWVGQDDIVFFCKALVTMGLLANFCYLSCDLLKWLFTLYHLIFSTCLVFLDSFSGWSF